jgi:hypothetical protein
LFVILSGAIRSEARMIGHARENCGVEESRVVQLTAKLHEILRLRSFLLRRNELRSG